MEELINIKDEEAVTTSLRVAEVFEKRHADVMRKIEQIINENSSTQNCVQCFKKSKYRDQSGKQNTMYYMNRDGFTFLVMGFTGKKANDWKWKYIEAFNQMESYINFRKADKQIQKYSMKFLQDNLEMPEPKDYIKANSIADKAVSNLFGFPKMQKKQEMSPEMIAAREPILKDTVELMAVKDKYDLDIKVSKSIYQRYQTV